MKKILVFTWSRVGKNIAYADYVWQLGSQLVRNNCELVYGGWKAGLMWVIAESVLMDWWKVTGVIPHFMKENEKSHAWLTKLIFVKDMYERKKIMYELSDAIIAAPWGYWTLDELFEILTLVKLWIYEKPIAILNINNFYTPLINLIQSMEDEWFISKKDRDIFFIIDDIDSLFWELNRRFLSN